MKMLLKKSLLATLVSSVVITTTPVMAIEGVLSRPPSAEELKKVETNAKVEMIKKELIKLSTVRDLGADTATAAKELGLNFYRLGIGADDVKAFVAKYASKEGQSKFNNTLALITAKGANSLSSSQLTEIVAAGLDGMDDHINPQALTLTGCTGLGIGIVLLVGTIVVGVIAIGKNKSEASVRSSYSDDRANLLSGYNNGVQSIKDKPNTLLNEITGLNSEKNQNNTSITTKQTQMVYENDEAVRRQLLLDIHNLQDRNSQIDASIQVKNQERANYLNPAYTANKISELTTQYNSNISSSLIDEANRVALIPEYKRQASTLGYVALGTGVLGALLTLDGAIDCSK